MIALNVVLLPSRGVAVKAQQINNKLWQLCGDDFTNFFKFDATHHVHISVLQFYAKNDETTINGIQRSLDPIFKNQSTLLEKVSDLKSGSKLDKEYTLDLQVESEAIKDLHKRVLEAVKPYIEEKGKIVDFRSGFYQQGLDVVGEDTANYVANFVKEKSGENYEPHMTTAVGTKAYTEEVANQKSEFAIPFDFTIDHAALCQLGHFCTSRKILHDWRFKQQ
jgi:hypothetical protein